MGEVKNILVAKPMNEILKDAAELPPTKPLYDPWWNEGEACFLFGSTGVGKTILAMQIAMQVSETNKVLYFDFELTDRQLLKRYQKDGKPAVFPENLIRVEMSRDVYINQDTIIKAIEDMIIEYEAYAAVIDNISWLFNDPKDPREAVNFMKKISLIKTKHNVSLLILAHTPKRNATSTKSKHGLVTFDYPLELADMAGSAALNNFIDSCFAIGRSRKDKSLRYLKQLKSRSSEIVHGEDNVLVCSLLKNDTGMLVLKEICTAHEQEHLVSDPSRQIADKDERNQKVRKFKEMNRKASLRETGTKFGLSHTQVKRILEEK